MPVGKTVIFDLDGTLADTGADLIAAANACFRRLGLGDQLHPARDKSTAFRGGRAMLRLGFARAGSGHGEAEVDASFVHLVAFYSDNIDRHSFLYPGVVAALDRLAAAGYRLGVCTNKPERLADMLLTSLGVRDRFVSLIGADTLPVRKPAPEPLVEAVSRVGGDLSQSVLVGDTHTDRDTGRAAGVPVILVTFGPDGDAVADLAPEALLSGYDALDDTVRALIG